MQHQGFQSQEQPPQEKKPSMEEILMQYILKNEATLQSQEATKRILETQLGQLANAIINRPQVSLPSSTCDIPRSHTRT